MNKTDLTNLLKALKVQPNKKLGQNFLIDANFLEWIVKESGAAEGVKIIEVGPGFGALTRLMLEKGAELTAVEFDHRIAEYLRSVLVPKGLKLIEQDACKTDFTAIYGKGVPYKFVSNLPYSAGTVVVANLIESEEPPEEMLIMLQKEVALRLAAKPGDDAYGALSVRAQNVFEVTPLRIAPPEMFHPRPEIDSCVIRMKRIADLAPYEARKMLSRVVRIGFSHRRKKMFKQIAGVFGQEQTHEAYTKASLSEDIRAERVTLEQFRILAGYFLAVN